MLEIESAENKDSGMDGELLLDEKDFYEKFGSGFFPSLLDKN